MTAAQNALPDQPTQVVLKEIPASAPTPLTNARVSGRIITHVAELGPPVLERMSCLGGLGSLGIRARHYFFFWYTDWTYRRVCSGGRMFGSGSCARTCDHARASFKGKGQALSHDVVP